jgi:CelD/BcsL family acetyltransferase involved in cellulose biosynthesis
MLEAELIEDMRRLEELRPEWHELAVASSSPMSLPAWMLGWLRHLAPAGAKPRVVAVRERGRLIGLAPMFIEINKPGRVDCRLLNASAPRASPLAVAGREWEVAELMGQVLAETRPRADAIALESGPVASHWPQALCCTWPGRVAPHAIQYNVMSSPVVSLASGSFEDWLASKSANFRAQMRRRRRQFAESGGVVRISTQETLRGDLDAFFRLHRSRWEGRGPSSIVESEDGVHAMLADVGAELLDGGRFRLILLELGGEPIAAQIHAAAGGEVLFLNGGWDERFARLSPSVLCLLAALEDAFARGDRRMDLAPGVQPYKLRMADGDDPVAWTLLMLPGPRLPLTYARTAPMLARRRLIELANRTLSEEQKDRLRRVRAGLRTGTVDAGS